MPLPPTPEAERLSPLDAVLSAIGATLLIGTELLGAVFAFAWAIGGLLGLGDTGHYVLMAIAGLPAIYACSILTRRVLRVEATLRGTPPAA